MDCSSQKVKGNELMQAEAHVVNQVLSFVNSIALKCAVQLGIPDIIHNHGQPITLSNLVSALSIPPARTNSVNRLMNLLVHSGFFATAKIDHNKEEEGFSLTPSSRLLLKDSPNSLSSFVLTMVNPFLVTPLQSLSDWFRGNGSTTFETANGMSFWNFLVTHPELQKSFHESLANESHLSMGVIVDEGKSVFENLKSLVDVGGGNGTTAQALVEAFPPLKCVVLDLPSVVADLPQRNNIEYIGGNMFESIPSADAALMKFVLHDWSDNDCIKILKKCKEAIPPREEGGKVIIIEIVMEDRTQEHETTETQYLFDIMVMGILGGKERSEKEWKNLFTESGFTDYKITRLSGFRSLIEVYP